MVTCPAALAIVLEELAAVLFLFIALWMSGRVTFFFFFFGEKRPFKGDSEITYSILIQLSFNGDSVMLVTGRTEKFALGLRSAGEG